MENAQVYFKDWDQRGGSEKTNSKSRCIVIFVPTFLEIFSLAIQGLVAALYYLDEDFKTH